MRKYQKKEPEGSFLYYLIITLPIISIYCSFQFFNTKRMRFFHGAYDKYAFITGSEIV